MRSPTPKKILFVVLNWGLGHACRSVPILSDLQNRGIELIIASDGIALTYLKKQFPNTEYLELPSYDIHYRGKQLTLSLLMQSPKILKAVFKEQKILKAYIKKHQIDGLISDNRFGTLGLSIPSVYITHQIMLPISGLTFAYIANKVHHFIISRHDQLWIADHPGNLSLAGPLSRAKAFPKADYLGCLSSLNFSTQKRKFDITFILSGPEPQRSTFEKIILLQIPRLKNKEILLVRGSDLELGSKVTNQGKGFTQINMASREELNTLINQSQFVICRSGYTSIMDIYKLQKKCLFVPTPGQKEQEVLAEYHSKIFDIPFQKQQEFDIVKALKQIKSSRPQFMEQWKYDNVDFLVSNWLDTV